MIPADRQFKTETSWLPLGSNLLLKPVTSEETSSGGIILPDTVRRKVSSGFIVKMGYDLARRREASSTSGFLDIGDEVFFEQHQEIPIILDDNNEHAYVIQADRVVLLRPFVPNPTV